LDGDDVVDVGASTVSVPATALTFVAAVRLLTLVDVDVDDACIRDLLAQMPA